MASAEARARWLRNANRFFINEDYKGVSTTHSSPSSSTKSESEGSASSLLPDTKWWLPQQPSCGDHNIYSRTLVDVLETRAASINQPGKHCGDKQFIQTAKDTAGSFCDPSWEALTMCMEKDTTGDFWLADEMPSKLSSELESHWIKVDKTEPWWQTADIDELASIVSHKSLEHFENCDLPGPRRKHTNSFDQDKGLASLGQNTMKKMSNPAYSMLKAPSSISMGNARCTLGAVGFSPQGSYAPFSRIDGSSTTKADEVETLNMPTSNLSKAQLLEALCHSQTRAREAEKAAQQAYDEKEHIIQLFFRQASQLFAYKQWLQILQLETICLRLRYDKNEPIYTCFPDFLPWVPTKGNQPKKDRRKAENRKPGPTRHSNCAAAFIMGLSLAGAGLLLGWTMGWLFPAH